MATINPFQGPINYSVDVQSPFEAAIGGFKLGAAGAEAQAQALVREQVKNAQTELATLFKNPNATAADYERVLPFLPKDQAAIVTQGFERKTKEQQQNSLQQTAQVYAALKSGQPDIAKNLLTEQANAFRNSGREPDAKATETYLRMIDLNPTGSQATIGLMMASLPGGKELLENVDKTLSTGRAEALAPQELRQKIAAADEAVAAATTAQATATNAAEQAAANAALARAQSDKAKVEAQFASRSAQASLDLTDAQIKEINTKIPEGARNLINESATAAAVSKQAATQYSDLANRIEAARGGKGRLTSATEWFAAQLGNQDAWTQIRNEYTRVRNSVAIKALPPGVATDKDIELALKGIPPENANAKTLASFLRGTAKLQDIDSSINNAKTDWLSQNNGLLTRSNKTFIAGDYATKPGETFNDFAQRIVGDVSKKYRSPEQIAKEKIQESIAQIPTTTPPAAPPGNVRARADAILSGGR